MLLCLSRLPRLYRDAVVARALRGASLPRPQQWPTLQDFADALALSPTRPTALRQSHWEADRVWRGDHWHLDLLSLPPTISLEEIEASYAAAAEWDRLNALRPAAQWAAELANSAGKMADDAWLAAASEEDITARAKLVADGWRRPLLRRAGKEDRALTPDEERRSCPKAQRRHLRKRAKTVRQFWSAALQMTGGPAEHRKPRFADDYSFERWEERQECAKGYGKAHVWVRREDGRSFDAWDIMQGSAVANLNRLYVQMRGLEDLADIVGLRALMLTLTLPAEWHPNPSQGHCTWTMDHTPDLADKELQRLWANFRSALKRAGIIILGLRVVEAHTDGCPHLHALLFVMPDQIATVDTALRSVRPDEWDDLPEDDEATLFRKAAQRADRRRRGLKQRVATDLVALDPRRARASTYVVKYLLKSLNVDPKQAFKAKGLVAEAKADIKRAMTSVPVAADVHRIEPSEDHVADYDRYRALASERGWRRYSLLGVHGMQRVWQRLHRMEAPDEKAPVNVLESWQTMTDQPAFHTAWTAMQGQRWADALTALGAVRHPLVCDMDAPRARLRYETYTNAYGEEARRAIAIGWTADPDWSLRLSDWTWGIERKDGEEGAEDTNRVNRDLSNALFSLGGTLAVNYPRAGAPAPANDDENTVVTAPSPRAAAIVKPFPRLFSLPKVVVCAAIPPPPTAGPRRRRACMMDYDDDEAA